MYLFAQPVTDQMAHNYSDVIRDPMDLQTMATRGEAGEYRNYAWVRESFEKMVYNALTFNRPRTAYYNEARRYYDACVAKVFTPKRKGAPPSHYATLITECLVKAQRDLQAEKERVTKDETAEV